MTSRRLNSGNCGLSGREIFGEFTFSYIPVQQLRRGLSWQQLVI